METIKSIKIAYIGGGSRQWARNLMSFLEPMTKQGLQFRYVDEVILKNVVLDKLSENPILLENVKKFKQE